MTISSVSPESPLVPILTAQYLWSVHDDLIHWGLAHLGSISGITRDSDVIADYEIGLMAPAEWAI